LRQNLIGSMPDRVGNFELVNLGKQLFYYDRRPFPDRQKLVTISGWEKSDDSRMYTASPASSHWPAFGVSSVTRGRWSSRSAAAEKNALRGVRARISHLLRPTAATRARHLLRRQAGLSRALGSRGRFPAAWRGD